MKFEFEQYSLPNGLNIILYPYHLIPAVAVNLWYKVGSKHEKPGRTGLAHLFEHMMFQGSANVPKNKHFEYLQQVGGIVNGSTFFDRTNYFETVPANYLELALWLESDRMGFLLETLDLDKFENQRAVVKNERRQRYENQPYGLAFETILKMVYPPDFAYHWPVIGWMEDLDAMTLDDVYAFFIKYYTPANVSLVIAGDFNADEAKKLVEKYFAGLPGSKPVNASIQKFNTYSPGEKRKTITDRVQLPRIYQAYPVPGYGSDAFYTVSVFSDILSEGKSSRLYRKLVHEKKLAQDISTFALNTVESSLLFVVSTAKPHIAIQELEKNIDEILEQYTSLQVDEKTLLKVKNKMEAAQIRDLQRISSKADMLNKYYTYFNKPELISDELNRFLAVTPEMILQEAKKYIHKDNRVIVTYMPEKTN